MKVPPFGSDGNEVRGLAWPSLVVWEVVVKPQGAQQSPGGLVTTEVSIQWV